MDDAHLKFTQCPKCPYWLPGDIDRRPLCPHDGTHEMMMVGIGHSDQAVCSCGWSSPTYWDGVAWAEADWKKHVAEQEAKP